jgi:hypothetical protein
MLYSGRVDFKKELAHLDGGSGYTASRPEGQNAVWNTPGGDVPTNTWIGYKLVVQNAPDMSRVRLTLYRDLTDGLEGGHWEELVRTEDAGDWQVTSVGACATSLNKMLLQPATSVFVRNDKVTAVEYKNFSVREIEVD